jgi:hypothetical protein
LPDRGERSVVVVLLGHGEHLGLFDTLARQAFAGGHAVHAMDVLATAAATVGAVSVLTTTRHPTAATKEDHAVTIDTTPGTYPSNDLHVEAWGDGTPVVLAHGSLATAAEEWEAQRPLAGWPRPRRPRAPEGVGPTIAAAVRDWFIGGQPAVSASRVRSGL